MLEFLVATVIVISIILLCVVAFIWTQINSTDSRLIRIIENRIRLNNVHYDFDRIIPVVIDEEN